jgi:hypothetical protein
MATTHFSGPVAIGAGSMETLAAAKTLTANDNGKTFLLNLAGGFTVTLPAHAAGLRFKFIVKTAPTTAYIIAAATADVDTITGGFSTADVIDAAVVDYDAAGDQINFVAATAVVGDWVEVISDGSNWYTSGHCNDQGGLTITG